MVEGSSVPCLRLDFSSDATRKAHHRCNLSNVIGRSRTRLPVA